MQEENRNEPAEAILKTLSQLINESNEHQSARVNIWVNTPPTLITAFSQLALEASVVGTIQVLILGSQSLHLAHFAANENTTGSPRTFASVQNNITSRMERTTALVCLSLATTESLNSLIKTFNSLPHNWSDISLRGHTR